MLLHCQPARQAHREEERRGEKRQVANGRPRQRRIKRRVPNAPHAHEAVGVLLLPHPPRRVHADVLAHGGKRHSGVEEHEPEVVLPNVGRLHAKERRNGLLALAPEVLEPVQHVELRRPRIVGDEQQVHMIRHDAEVAGREKRPAPVDAAPERGDGLSRRQQRRGPAGRAVAPRLFHDARKRLRPSAQGEREEEEPTAGFVELQFHGYVL